MKRYRIGQKKIIACSILAFSAIVAGAPAVTAFAEESAVPADTAETSKLEALRLKKEEAQAAYDAALNDNLLAEDVVENAKRAVNDAQEEYDRILEQYSTGFAGFLRWVIETETDPVKVEDARQVLESSFEDGTIVDLDDPANLTRMLYMADWLEDLSKYFRDKFGLEAGTSHAVMRLSQYSLDEYNEHLEKGVYEEVYDEAVHKNEGLMSLAQKAGKFEGMWYTNTDHPVSHPKYEEYIGGSILFEQADGLEYYTSKLSQIINSDTNVYMNTTVMNKNGMIEHDSYRDMLIPMPLDVHDYKKSLWAVSYATEPMIDINVEITPFEAAYTEGAVAEAGVDEAMALQDVISEDQVINGKEGTTIQIPNEITSAYRGSGSLRSPEILEEELANIMSDLAYPPFFLYNFLNSSNITIGEAIGTDPDTGTNVAMGTFFNGQGTYTVDEYVRDLREYFSITDPSAAKTVLDERNDDLNNAARNLAGADEALLSAYGRLKGAEKEYEEAVTGFAGQTGIPDEAAEGAVEVVYAGQEINDAEPVPGVNVVSQEAVVSEPANDAGMANTSRETAAAGYDISAEQIPEVSVALAQIYPENETPETYSATDVEQEDTVTVSSPESGSPVKITVENAEIKTEGSAATVTMSKEKEDSSENSTEDDKQNPGILAEVLSYLFNGGAIAFIIPAGFKKRKRNKGIGSILQEDF